MFSMLRNGVFGRLKIACGLPLILSVPLGPIPLLAQDAQSASALPNICNVFAGETNAAGLQTVYASCWGNGIVLGEAEQYQSYTYSDLGAVVVGLVRSDSRKVLLLRARADGLPVVDDLGPVLANAAGRTPLGRTDGLVFDFDAFAASGVIAVQEENGARGQQMQRQAVQTEGDMLGANIADIGAMIAADPAAAANSQAAQ